MELILFVSNSGDIHTDLLVQASGLLSKPFFRINTDHFRPAGDIQLQLSNKKSESVISFKDRSININDIALLVFRRPKSAFNNQNALPWISKLLNQEWKCVEEALSIMTKAIIVNSLDSSALARNKIIQLQYANLSGLKIPETLISTNKDKLKDFANTHNHVITKGISSSYIIDGEIVRTGFTTDINLEELTSYNPIGCPTLMQDKISAAAIWRIVLVGDMIFSVRYTGEALTNVNYNFRQRQLFLPDYMLVYQCRQRVT